MVFLGRGGESGCGGWERKDLKFCLVPLFQSDLVFVCTVVALSIAAVTVTVIVVTVTAQGRKLI